MRLSARFVSHVGSLLLGFPSLALAGMPSITLTDIARMRIQAISFFLVCFLLSAWVIQRIWNSLAQDFPRMPRISYSRSLGLVALWGLLFLLVLTMISGARELMTPGAWRKVGYTYSLDEATPALPQVRTDSDRRQSIDRLRVALWTYARGHGGEFPPSPPPEIPEEAWQVADVSGMRYIYRGGQVADRGESPLVIEPGIFGDVRLVLLTNGQVRRMTTAELRQPPGQGGR